MKYLYYLFTAWVCASAMAFYLWVAYWLFTNGAIFLALLWLFIWPFFLLEVKNEGRI